MEKIILSARQMLQTFKISRQTLSRWTERGCPRVEKGKYPLPEVIQWRDDVLLGNNLDAMRAARLRREVARAEREELRAKQERGELVKRGEAIAWVSGLVSEARQGFMGLPRRMGEQLAPISDAREIEAELRKEIYRILEMLSREKKGQPARALKK